MPNQPEARVELGAPIPETPPKPPRYPQRAPTVTLAQVAQRLGVQPTGEVMDQPVYALEEVLNALLDRLPAPSPRAGGQ